jgi:hypothetical protein
MKAASMPRDPRFLAKDEHAYRFAKEIGLEPLPVNSSDASIIRGELILDTWGDGSRQAALSGTRSRELQEVQERNAHD